jgi:hypothetical protein
MNRKMLAPLVIALALAAPSGANASRAATDASIPFANHGGVYTWEVERDGAIWFQDNHRHWYRATLMGNAFDLPFAETIGIDTRPGGSLDRWGAIIVKGHRYQIATFTAMPGPPPKFAHNKAAADPSAKHPR